MEKGDSGSIVYLLAEGEDSEDQMLGMFVGYLEVEKRLHLAIILSLAIKQVEQFAEFQVEELSHLHSQSNLFDSGYKSNTGSCVSLSTQTVSAAGQR